MTFLRFHNFFGKLYESCLRFRVLTLCHSHYVVCVSVYLGSIFWREIEVQEAFWFWRHSPFALHHKSIAEKSFTWHFFVVIFSRFLFKRPLKVFYCRSGSASILDPERFKRWNTYWNTKWKPWEKACNTIHLAQWYFGINSRCCVI